MITQEQLSLVETDELLKALSSRFKYVVFTGCHFPMYNIKETTRRFFGDSTVCSGLATELSIWCAGHGLTNERHADGKGT